MNTKRLTLLLAAGSAAAIGGVAFSLRAVEKKQSPPSTANTGVALAQTPATASTEAIKLKANEIGRIPILMYHSVDENGKYDKRGLNIPGTVFRKHLDMMVKAGWYPMNARDIYFPEKLQAVPAGMTPVVLTFDDARGSQFKMKPDGSIAPSCVVGILESYHKKYGEKWPRAGTFFALPKSSYNPTPFWQAGLEAKKCQWLVTNGYELSNHSFAHKNMAPMNAAQVREAVWGCVRDIRKLAPNATMDTFCVPYGSYPKDKSTWGILLNDPQGQYKNLVAFKAWGDESFAPGDKRFNPKEVDRIGVDPGYFEQVFARLEKAGKLYVSDGNPTTMTIPKSWQDFVSPNRPGKLPVVFYGQAATPKATKAKLKIKPATAAKKKTAATVAKTVKHP
jgi:peptidoglycan/xylan/chitin deacetylase (PgdA/CDA1 family)